MCTIIRTSESYLNYYDYTGVEENEISLLVASVDLDKDGSLSFEEFTKVMFGAQSKTV